MYVEKKILVIRIFNIWFDSSSQYKFIQDNYQISASLQIRPSPSVPQIF